MDCCHGPRPQRPGAADAAQRWRAASRRSPLARLRMRLAAAAGLRGPGAIPLYWENADKDLQRGVRRSDPDFFDDMFPVPPWGRELLQRLMNEARGEEESDTEGQDGGRGDFRVVRALRVESSRIWTGYQRRLRKTKVKRGPCRFAGKGAPLTMVSLARERRTMPDTETLATTLDEDVCEAYLWHGTSPHVALQIAQGGFKADQKNSAGKRFGAGGYFSEEAGKADVYARAGDGIYKDCFAMLLCRVVLGRQYRVDAFRRESATQEARAAHRDSTLAEPRGASFREFVVFDSAQVYPEYALVYERGVARPARESPGGCHETSPPEGAESHEHHVGVELLFPGYWCYTPSTTSCSFHEMFPDAHMRPIVQALLDDTWVDAVTADRTGKGGRPVAAGDPEGDMPLGLRALKVWRVEDSEFWTAYARTRAGLRGERATTAGVLRTVAGLPWREQQRLDAASNEAYLWLGCSPQEATRIVEQGVVASEGGRRAGDCSVFADSSSKADETSQDDKDGYYRGYYAMLLCRVAMGACLPLEPDAVAEEVVQARVGLGCEFHSALRWRTASVDTFRELLVPSRAQVYPEYVVVYERLYYKPRARGVELEDGATSSSSDFGDSAKIEDRAAPAAATKQGPPQWRPLQQPQVRLAPPPPSAWSSPPAPAATLTTRAPVVVTSAEAVAGGRLGGGTGLPARNPAAPTMFLGYGAQLPRSAGALVRPLPTASGLS